MAHVQQFFYVNAIKQFLPEYFEGKKVLEIGSLNLNGSIRQFYQGCEYTGLDIGEGRDVDVVCPGEHFGAPAASFDVVVSCEAMEHNPAWRATWLNMLRLMKPTGLLIMTCATTGRRQHGTEEFLPADSPLTVGKKQNYYRNLLAQDFTSLCQMESWFPVQAFHTDYSCHDLYFFGIGPECSADVRSRAQSLLNSLDKYFHDKNILGRY